MSSIFKNLFERSKIFFEEHPEAKKALTSQIGLTMAGVVAICTQGYTEKTKEKIERGIVRCATKDSQRIYERNDYAYNEVEDYDIDIIRKNNPTRTMIICDKYIDWMAQSSMDSIMESFNESKEQYLE